MSKPAEKPKPAVVGDQIDHYVIESEIGHGGMGVVYRALDQKLGRRVALKFPWADAAEDENSLQRFRREARSSSVLNHPNIVSVIEVLEHQGLPCLVLQLIDGTNLRTHLQERGALTADRAVRISEDDAKALAEAHSQHILHRDVNPRNILIAKDGRALLTDFGLARVVHADPVDSDTTSSLTLTPSGAVVGTPRYMSPEQAIGKEVDERSDIFSLGAVMYEMCTGSPAFTGTEVGELYDQILHTEPKPIASFTYELPDELERIVRKALNKRPDERYQSAEDLQVDLRALRREVEHEAYTSFHGSSTQQLAAPKASSRRPRMWAAIGVAVIAAAAWYSWPRDEHPLPRGRPIQVTDTEAWEGQPAISPDGTQIAYVSDAAGNLDLYVIAAHGGTPLQLTDDPGEDRHPFWFPDGSELGFVSDRDGEIALWKVGRFGGGATKVMRGTRDPAVSPSGQEVAFSAIAAVREELRIATARLPGPSEIRFITHDDDGEWNHRAPAWSPNGAQICYRDFSSLWLVPAQGGDATRLATDSGPDDLPVWSPSGRHIYFSSQREGTQALWRIDLDSRNMQRVTLGTGTESWPSISGDGKRLAYTTGLADNDVVLMDRQTGQAVRLPEVGFILSLAPDLDRVVYTRRRPGGGADLWEQPLQGGRPHGRPRRLTDHEGTASHPAISPDGQWIAYYRLVDERRDIWIVSIAGGEPLRFTEGGTNIHPAWSPDGTRLLYISSEGKESRIMTAAVQRGHRQGESTPVTPPGVPAYSAAWSPDGTRIAYVGFGEGGHEEEEPVSLDVFVLPAQGGESVRLTRGADAARLRWDSSTGHVLASGRWGGDQYVIMSIATIEEEPQPLDPPVVIGGPGAFPLFDVSLDGRYLAYGRWNLRGDIWLLESEDGSY